MAMQGMHDVFMMGGKSAGVDTLVSGTTAVAALICDSALYVANVGDSRAIAFSKLQGIVSLSSDHKPQREDERARIEDTGAAILSEVEIRGCGDPDKEYVCKEADNGNIVYGVLFSRSIGDEDAHENLGISSEAEIFEFNSVQGNDTGYVVIASDGVWDKLENEQVADIITNEACPMKAANNIVDESAKGWDVDPSGRRDDITCLVLEFSNMIITESS